MLSGSELQRLARNQRSSSSSEVRERMVAAVPPNDFSGSIDDFVCELFNRDIEWGEMILATDLLEIVRECEGGDSEWNETRG